ncbi:EutN/CcmL family microcompartment protein [Pelagicoccus albus]|uniref:Carbon dioxide concentrating mechanism protein CcmL n=1 Tax=Pelagicoccus albus TaxID=415222 RepID=A0A7X1E7K0_9BACT|nr:EutN/CcmL family microcompartment protein [Pelagicoccus albus]MBC2605223.1 carbon dioxide concentrating mechanism protein CcmL [Pelagicoccus albus]
MKMGTVIGTVTFGDLASEFRGGRWLMVSPMGTEELSGRREYGKASTPVVYDRLGAGVGDQILYVEGAEATQPFPHPVPLDAITVALVDTFQFSPPA